MRIRSWGFAAALALLSACGGGGGGGEPAEPAGAGSSQADLRVTTAVSASLVPAGTTTTLTLTVRNAGPAAAKGVELYADFAGGVSVVDDDLACAASGGAVCPTEDTIPDIPVGGQLTITVPVEVASWVRGAVTSTLAAAAANETALDDNESAAVLQVYQADVSVTARGPSAPVQAGGTMSYTMTVLNAGPDDALDVSIENTLGPSLTAGTVTCRAAGGATCPANPGASMRVPVLPRNGSLTFDVGVQVAPGTSGSVATVMIATAAGDPQAANNSAAASVGTYVTTVGGRTSITLQSDRGDFVGQGGSYAYTPANAVLSFNAVGGVLRVQVDGDEWWYGEFALPSALTQFVPGTYTELTRSPFRNPAVGGLEWTGQGRGCNVLSGSMVVNSATYTAGVLSAIDLVFQQNCDGSAAALRGQLKWSASDNTSPPGPVNPPPAGLWSPSATPPSGSYVVLESQPGDWIGAGRNTTYTKANARMSVTETSGHVVVDILGDQTWRADFVTMNSLAQLQPGYYGELHRYPFNNPVRGGMNWSGDGRGCNELSGWFVVDNVTRSNGSLATLDLRFEQLCDDSAGVLHGKVHWEAGDTTTPPGPQPIPSQLWSPAAGTTPASGNYMLLVSEPGDYIGAAGTSTVTQLSPFTGTGRVDITGGGWTGNFQAMDGLSQLQPGYYPDLRRYPFHNVARGGLSFSGNGRGCNELNGWFAVDSVSYDGSGLASIDLRFEQHCDGAGPALRGKVHWAR